MQKLFYFLILSNSLGLYAHAWDVKPSGTINAKLLGYTEDVNQAVGENIKINVELKSVFSEQWSMKNQLRTLATSLSSNLTSKTTIDSKDQFEVFEGDNYLQYKNDWTITQLGYQTVIWGESFGFNYADMINPKDLRETMYSDIADARRPLFLVNSKILLNGESINGSLQLLFSPQPKFDKNLPLEMFTAKALPQYTFIISSDHSKAFFEEKEYGAKLSLSFKGFDSSIFYFDHLDRNAFYEVTNINGSNLYLSENHSRTKSIGASVAHSFYDFTTRADIVFNQDKKYNYLQNNLLKNGISSETNAVLSVDTPTYNDYSFAIVYAQSSLLDEFPNAFRAQKDQFGILKITKTLSNEKNLEMSVTRDLSNSAYAIQSIFSAPLSNLTEIKIGAETYMGDDQSEMSKLKKISNVFISLKNYIQF